MWSFTRRHVLATRRDTWANWLSPFSIKLRHYAVSVHLASKPQRGHFWNEPLELEALVLVTPFTILHPTKARHFGHRTPIAKDAAPSKAPSAPHTTYSGASGDMKIVVPVTISSPASHTFHCCLVLWSQVLLFSSIRNALGMHFAPIRALTCPQLI